MPIKKKIERNKAISELKFYTIHKQNQLIPYYIQPMKKILGHLNTSCELSMRKH